MFPEKRVLRRVRYLGRIVPLLGLPAETVSGTGAFWSRPVGGGGEERTGSPVAAFGHSVRLHPASQHSHTTAGIRIGDKRLRYFPEHAANWPLERPGTHSAGCSGACCLDVGPHRLAPELCVLVIPELKPNREKSGAVEDAPL